MQVGLVAVDVVEWEKGCGVGASGTCGPGSAISYLTLTLYCIILYSILFNAWDPSFNSISLFHFVY